jgi:hypothetical protein
MNLMGGARSIISFPIVRSICHSETVLTDRKAKVQEMFLEDGGLGLLCKELDNAKNEMHDMMTASLERLLANRMFSILFILTLTPHCTLTRNLANLYPLLRKNLASFFDVLKPQYKMKTQLAGLEALTTLFDGIVLYNE